MRMVSVKQCISSSERVVGSEERLRSSGVVGALAASGRWQWLAYSAVKLDPGWCRNVKSSVESDVGLSCSVVIFPARV